MARNTRSSNQAAPLDPAAQLPVGVAAADRPKTVVEFAYDRMRSDILCGNLRPEAKLRVDQLHEEYGIGVNSLREALAKLTMD
ncbi:MAG: GntR family transcriptional regulator, partial [Rhodospirillales bacterium]|nr:GntR family transcriptional regulator [Rhodospirillales bacterium]